jgi:hypothetical protein
METEGGSVFDLPGFAEPSGGRAAAAGPAAAPPAPRGPRARRAAPPPPAAGGSGDLVPWASVQAALSMAHDALEAKQRAAEVRTGRRATPRVPRGPCERRAAQRALARAGQPAASLLPTCPHPPHTLSVPPPLSSPRRC